jgi:hypothetical protein
MTTNEIIKEIAVYDGWEINDKHVSTHTEYKLVINGEFIKGCWIANSEKITTNPMLNAYLTDLNILHRVAVKVYRELIDSPCHDDISDLTDRCSNIQFALLKEPINGEYITLATATAEAIVYLKKYKA